LVLAVILLHLARVEDQEDEGRIRKLPSGSGSRHQKLCCYWHVLDLQAHWVSMRPVLHLACLLCQQQRTRAALPQT